MGTRSIKGSNNNNCNVGAIFHTAKKIEEVGVQGIETDLSRGDQAYPTATRENAKQGLERKG